MDNEYYLNNVLLKKSGKKTAFTPEQVIEITRCYDDVIYFIKNYIYIISLDEGRVLFDLYDYQADMVNKFNKHRFVICTLSRQMGKCVRKDTKITVRNKKTGIVEEIAFEDFYNKVKGEHVC